MDSKLKIIENLITEGESFNFNNFSNTKYTNHGVYGGTDKPQWATFKTRVKNIISSSLSPNSPAVQLVDEALKTRTDGYSNDTFEFVQNNLIEALRQLEISLTDDVYGELKKEKSTAYSPAFSNKVFIVHGHDDELKLDVERFISEIGLEPIILHRQLDQGKTIIEKFEEYSDVGFAFVLLTPDEIAYLKSEQNKLEEERQTEFRARPNVIFEYGYFVGRLGRARVCCLSKGNVALPSDISGLIYKSINKTVDEQGIAIIRELKAAGYNIKI